MSSPHLAIAHVAAAQNQKEVTINDAVDALDRASNAVLEVALADADVTLTTAQVTRHGLIVLTGALTQGRAVTLPASARRLAVCNATSGGWDVTLQYAGAGQGVTLAAGATSLLHGDGTDLRAVTYPAPVQEISLFAAGTLASDQVLLHQPVTRTLTLPQGLTGSHGVARVAATAQVDLDLQVNSTSLGTISFAVGSAVGSFAAASVVSLVAGDTVTVLAPAGADTTLADLGISFLARVMP